jgi:hypothetical protein
MAPGRVWTDVTGLAWMAARLYSLACHSVLVLEVVLVALVELVNLEWVAWA